jgi:invasion protein IalB
MLASPVLAATSETPGAPAASAAAPATPAPSARKQTLSEAIDDWQVVCSETATDPNNCTMLQQLMTQKGQRILAIELRPAGRSLTGTLIMPFGLDLATGVRLQVDNTDQTKPLPFATCLYDGCIVPLNLTEAITTAIRAGNQMKVTAMGYDGDEFALAISLKGVSRASDRILAIVHPGP